MASCLLYQCDICNKSEISKGELPKDWFEFDYLFNSTGVKNTSLTYLVCSLKCYIVQLDLCLNQALTSGHSNVRIADMSTNFVRKLLERVDVGRVEQLICDGKKENPLIKEKIIEPEPEKSANIKKSRIISIKEFSTNKLQWLEDFAFENSDEKLINKTESIWEHDNIVTYDSLIDLEIPKIPCIRYKNYYLLFCYDNKVSEFNELKSQNL